MKVLALVKDARDASYRYRIEAFAWALAQRGMPLEVWPLERGAWGRARQFRAAGEAAAVILQRRLLPIWQLALLRRHARRLLFDVDDAVFQRDSYSRKGAASRMRTGRFWATVYAADAVICGNEYLRRRAQAYCSPQRAHLVPTVLEPRWYRPVRHRRTGSSVRLVWIGQGSTLGSLARAGEQLRAVARRLPGIELRVICDRSIDLPPLGVVARPWSSATEAAELAAGDIGVTWLPDDAWSRGKCGLRVLQFMAAGLPVVANPVGMNRRMVVDGRTGLWATTPGEWAEAVARLAADARLRAAWGAAGRRLVEQHYSVAGWGPRFAALVEAIVCGRPAQRRVESRAAEESSVSPFLDLPRCRAGIDCR